MHEKIFLLATAIKWAKRRLGAKTPGFYEEPPLQESLFHTIYMPVVRPGSTCSKEHRLYQRASHRKGRVARHPRRHHPYARRPHLHQQQCRRLLPAGPPRRQRRACHLLGLRLSARHPPGGPAQEPSPGQTPARRHHAAGSRRHRIHPARTDGRGAAPHPRNCRHMPQRESLAGCPPRVWRRSLQLVAQQPSDHRYFDSMAVFPPQEISFIDMQQDHGHYDEGYWKHVNFVPLDAETEQHPKP